MDAFTEFAVNTNFWLGAAVIYFGAVALMVTLLKTKKNSQGVAVASNLQMFIFTIVMILGFAFVYYLDTQTGVTISF